MRYSNVPGLEKPVQPLEVWYSGAYAQDEWRPRRDLTVTAGVRMDVSVFKNTAFQNARADALTFRDQDGSPVQYQTGKMPDPKVLWSPRTAANWDIAGRGRTQVRMGTGLFTGPPLYVWISNQLGNTGVLIGEVLVDNTIGVSVHHESRQIQAGERHRRRRNELRAERHRPGLQVPAGVAHQPGRRPSASRSA